MNHMDSKCQSSHPHMWKEFGNLLEAGIYNVTVVQTNKKVDEQISLVIGKSEPLLTMVNITIPRDSNKRNVQ